MSGAVGRSFTRNQYMFTGLQVYKAETPGVPLRVYNMWYARSLEFDRYTAALQREQKIFEDLIQQKAYIVLPDIDQVRPPPPPLSPTTHTHTPHTHVISLLWHLYLLDNSHKSTSPCGKMYG